MGMTPYYAELSFGGTTLHLSGSADDGIPDGLGIAKEGIEGLLSSPALKVTATERSYGNGGHDVAESDVQYAVRTLSVHFLAMGNGRSDAMAHLNALAASTGRVVRLRVVDAQRDVYCVGYCQRDVEATWSDGRFTGTLTIVCQRPELLSTRASQMQLMPVSRVRGGMSYGVPAYELAWTGTPNASTSTLSQDGQVVATNLDIDPACLQIRYCNPTTVSARQNADDTWTYTTIDGTMRWIIPILTLPVPVPGMIIFVQWAETNVQQDGVEGTLVASGPGWAAYAVNAKLKMGIYYPVGVSFTLLHIGFYTAADWQAMQARGITWFDGDSQSPQPNAGLSYGPDGRGLSYGVSVAEERNLVIVGNRGTTVSYPTLTVTGPFPDGVEIQTGSGGVIRYTGAIGMVPLVIQCDPRNVAASMGGVDVGRYLTGRDLPAIPAGGSMSLRLMSAGSGWVTVTVRDTYL